MVKSDGIHIFSLFPAMYLRRSIKQICVPDLRSDKARPRQHGAGSSGDFQTFQVEKNSHNVGKYPSVDETERYPCENIKKEQYQRF